MSVIIEKGLILREISAGEANKRLGLLTEGRGKIVVFARGAKNATSKLAASKISYNEFVMYDGGRFLSLNQVSSIENFDKIADDYDKYCLFNFFLEMADKMLLEDMEAAAVLSLLANSLFQLNLGTRNCKQIFAAFVFKFLKNEGYQPFLGACGDCGDEFAPLFGGEGTLCENCGELQRNESCFFSAEANSALKYILDAKMPKLFNFKASEDVLDALAAVALIFLRHNIDINFKSLPFIEEMF